MSTYAKNTSRESGLGGSMNAKANSSLSSSREATTGRMNNATTSKRAATTTTSAGLSSTHYNANHGHNRGHQDEQSQQELMQQLNSQPSVRNIVGFIDKYDRVESQELLSQMGTHWLLSLEDVKLPIEHPYGLMSQMPPLKDDTHLLVLVACDEADFDLDYREIHQMLRDLTIGMYVLNQQPYLHLKANIDESSCCQMPPAYADTKIGQLMVNTDYWLKALWHGAYFAREKRIKFSERWRQLLDVEPANGQPQVAPSSRQLQEFLNAGLADITKDPEYAECIRAQQQPQPAPFSSMPQIPKSSGSNISLYSNQINTSRHGVPSEYVELYQSTHMTDERIKAEMNHFHEYVNDMSAVLTCGLKSVKAYRNLYTIEADHEITMCCRADADRIKNSTYDRLKPIMSMHEKFLRENFTRKLEVRRNLKLLSIVSFLVPVLAGLKRRMRIPDMNELLPLMTGEDVHSERELPPLILANDFQSHLFANQSSSTSSHHQSSGNINANSAEGKKYFHLHGGVQFEVETCPIDINCQNEFESEFDRISSECTKALKAYLESEQQLQEYKVPVIQVNNKKYWALKIDFEPYYAQYPQKPFWVSKMTEDLSKLKPKRLPMNDYQIYDLFKKHFGNKKATKYKHEAAGLKASAQRGLLAVFQSLARRTPTNQLSKHDENGLGLMHYAAIYNNPSIITALMLNGIDANIKQQVEYIAVGPMPVHYAARCGSLDALSCLTANYANVSFADHEGWTPVHHAAYFDNVPALRLLVRRQPELLELATRANDSTKRRHTPLLVAASAGALQALKCLIKFGANKLYVDEAGHNVLHVAALRNHVNIINHFIDESYPEIEAWKVLIDMLTSSREQDTRECVRCLQLMTNTNRKHWRSILKANGIDRLCDILKKYANTVSPDKSTLQQQQLLQKKRISTRIDDDNDEEADQNLKKQQLEDLESLTLNTISVLCNLADQIEIKEKLSSTDGLIAVLTRILTASGNEDIQSRVSILIADVASIESDNKSKFAQQGCLARLIDLLRQSATEDLLINTVNALEIVCLGNVDNQNFCANNGVFLCFMDLLNLNSDLLKSSVSAAISAITHNNRANQLLALEQGLIHPVVELLKSRNMTVQVKAGLALESLALNNQTTQNAIIELDAVSYMIRLLEDHTRLAAIFEYRKFSNHQKITFNLEFQNGEHNQILTLHLKDIFDNEKMYYAGATIKSNMEDWSILVREQAAFTLWTLAGDKKPQRKMIAERIGIQQILSMVMCKSEKLQYVGAKCMQSLALENAYYQNALLKESGAEQLMRLLKQERPSDRVVLATVETIAAMCIDIAHVSNERSQNELCERGALKSLLDLIDSEGLVGASYEDSDAASRYNMSRCIVIETAYALACLLLHRDKDELVEDRLDLRFIVGLIDTDNLDLRLEAGLAITVFAFNNNERQYEMKKAGGISYESYRVFFEDPNVDPIQLAKACFQVVVLARVISDQDLVLLTAMAISKLVHLLLYPDDQVVIQSASFLSSLAHTRAGITDAMITCDAVDILCDRLFHPKSSEVRYTCAVALGYLTFNRTASRLLLHNCRNSPQLFNTLMEQLKLGDPKTYSSATASSRNALPTTPNSRRGVISRQFVESFETALALGLPKLLMKNRVKFYESDKDSNKPYMSTPREESFFGSRNSSKRGSTMKRDSESPMPRAKTAIGLSFRSQSAPMTVMINALSKAQRAAAVEKTAETVETRPIKSVRPTLGTRPYTQFDIKRK